MDYTLWINRAISQIGGLIAGTEFVLKDLFLGTEWNQISGGEKRELGRQFKNEVVKGRIPNVRFIGKANNNSSKYLKN